MALPFEWFGVVPHSGHFLLVLHGLLGASLIRGPMVALTAIINRVITPILVILMLVARLIIELLSIRLALIIL